MRARAVDATLAALATMIAAWPLSTLLEQPTWVRSCLVLVAVVALSGVGARLLALRGWQVAAVQLVAVLLTAGGLYGRGHLWHGLPTADTARAAGTLLTQAMVTIQSYPAPAPTTRGITLLVGCSIALVALLVDYLAVTRRSPSLAGLPLLATFLGAAANSGASLGPQFFLAAAGAWLVLVARQGSFLLHRWSTTVATPLTPVRDSGRRLRGRDLRHRGPVAGCRCAHRRGRAAGRAAAPADPVPARRPRPRRRGRRRRRIGGVLPEPRTWPPT